MCAALKESAYRAARNGIYLAGATAGGALLEYNTEEKTRMVFKQDHRSRKLKQIFVRGSNIVMISAADAGPA